MFIAQQLSRTNRIEHLLYLWQVEDILRAYDLDADRVIAEYLSRCQLDDATRQATEVWYRDLCRMMQTEGLRNRGHLQIHRNLLHELEEIHAKLLADTRYPYYREMYYKVLPYIVQLRAKGSDPKASEIEVCLDALYGILLLRLQHKPISPETERATKDISTLLGQLSDYYFKLKDNPEEA